MSNYGSVEGSTTATSSPSPSTASATAIDHNNIAKETSPLLQAAPSPSHSQAPPASFDHFHAAIRADAAREELDIAHSSPSSRFNPDTVDNVSCVAVREARRSGFNAWPASAPAGASPEFGAAHEDADGAVVDVGSVGIGGASARETRTYPPSFKRDNTDTTSCSPTATSCTPTDIVVGVAGNDGDRNGCVQWLSGLPVIGDACVQLVQYAERTVPPGGHLSNVFNMASNTLGIGIVSMASGFNTTGIGLAVILMVVCAVLVVFSFYLIGATCERSPYRSWESACRGILFRGADYCVAGVMIFFQFGTMVGFVTAAHDLIGPFIGDAASATEATHKQQRLITVVVWFFGMLPLCLPRRVASLRYFSIVGVTLVIYFVFAVVAHSAMAGLPHVHNMKIFASGLDAVNGLTLFIFAFLGHGLCFRLFDEMQVPSARNLLKDGCGSVSLIGVLYFIVGFFGYAEFGLDMTGSIFKYYSVRDEPMMCVAYIGIMLKICVAYALSGQACRLPVYYILRRDIDASSYRLHLLITIPLCVLSLIAGMYVPDINIVFNLLGSICGGILAFLLPAFFVMYLGGWTLKRIGWVRLVMTYLNIVAGVVAIVFGTAVTIDGMVRAK